MAETDRAIFLSSRALQGGPRWGMAINDLSETRILGDLSCAVGVQLRARDLPALRGLLLKMAPDVSRAVSRPKRAWDRPRPYLVDEGPICTKPTAGLARSPDYPSGHATWGWSVGLVMAELVPDRASAILARSRAFGESRLVCGVHNASSVAAGRTNAEALVAVLHGSPAFRADLDDARRELETVLRTGRPATGCDAEAAAMATPLP
ncbi:MAG: acid phosphatase [Caulobacter sp.]